MYHTIKTEPNNEYSPPPIRQFLIKEELIDNSYSLSIPKNTVEQEAIDKRLESEIRNESVKEESIREPLRSLMSETARTEEHFSPENVHIHYQTQNNLVMSSFDRFFPTQVPEITIKQEPISENLQLRTREEDHVVKKMYQTVEIDSNHEYSLPPLRQSLIKEELIDDSYSFSITERTVNRMVKSKYQTQSNLTIPSFNGLLPTQTTELTIKQESTSEKWQRAQPEENGDDDNIVEEWDASTELDQFPTSENIDSEEATVPQKASNDSTRESFTQWSPEWDSLIMDEFFECIKRTNRPGFKNIAEAFLKKHKVGICLHTAVVCFKRVFQKRLRDPNVPEEEKTRMLKATKSWKMTKRYQEDTLYNRRPNERIRNTTKTSVGTIQWSNSWNKIIMDEFMKLAMDGSLDVFSVSKFCGKFKDEHDLAIAVSRLVMNFKQAFNDRLNDVHVELESKLKMLLKYKTKEMQRAIKTEPNDEDVPARIEKFLVKQESTDSFSIHANRVKQAPNNDTLESNISDRMVKNESFQEPIQSLVSQTSQPEGHISTVNDCMQYQTLSNMVMPPFNGFFETQTPEKTIKQESISEHLQITEDERDAQEDNARMDMYRNFETNPNDEHSQPPIMKFGIKEELVDDSYSNPENTMKQDEIDKRLESKTCEGMVKNESFRGPLRSFMDDIAQNEDHFLPGNAYMQLLSQNNLAIPSFNGLFPTQIPELTTKKESTSEKRHAKNNEGDNVVEKWDASTELDQLPTSDYINPKEATVSQKAFTGSTQERFLQWSSECDNLLMDDFLKCFRETKQFDLNHIAEEFLKNHKVDVSLNTVKKCLKQMLLKRLTDPNVSEEEKKDMQKAAKHMNMTKTFREDASNNKPPSQRISNSSVGYDWSNSWDEKIMDEFMKRVMHGSSQSFHVNKFCAKFKAEHNLAIEDSRLKSNFNQLFDARLKDANVKLETKLKMLLEYKRKVPLELTEQFASLGNVLYSNSGSITSYFPNTNTSMLQELGFIPMDLSSLNQHTIVPRNNFMTNATSTTSKTINKSTYQRNFITSESYEWNNSWDKKLMNEFMKLATDGSSESFSLKKFCEKFKTDHNLAMPFSRLARIFKQRFDERLGDDTVELESKLKMLLKHKTKVPLELTIQFATLGTIQYSNTGSIISFVRNTGSSTQELGYIPLDISFLRQHTIVPHNDFMTNSTSTTSETVQQELSEYSKTQSSVGPVRREEHR